jgi:NADH-quinone oxidoreductase subunit E
MDAARPELTSLTALRWLRLGALRIASTGGVKPMTAAETTSPADLGPALRIVEEMQPITESSIIPLLQRLQSSYGYLPREVVLDVCERTALPASRVFGVATFYAQFHLAPRGRHLIRCCRGTACHVKGSHSIAQSISRELEVGKGGTTEDLRFTFETVACLGTCFLAPVIMVDDDYYGTVKPAAIGGILSKYE